MNYASRLSILAIGISTSVSCNVPKRTFEQVSQDFKQAAPVFIDWGMNQMHKYPAIPGILTAAILAKGKESITLKRSSFVVWATLGAVVFAEPYRLLAQEYFAQRNMQKKENAKVASEAVVLAVQQGSQELREKASEKLEDLKKMSDSK